jgi:hypothetical protein
MHTRPVDTVYLVPGAEVAVFEHGSIWRQLIGERSRERCLALSNFSRD